MYHGCCTPELIMSGEELWPIASLLDSIFMNIRSNMYCEFRKLNYRVFNSDEAEKKLYDHIFRVSRSDLTKRVYEKLVELYITCMNLKVSEYNLKNENIKLQKELKIKNESISNLEKEYKHTWGKLCNLKENSIDKHEILSHENDLVFIHKLIKWFEYLGGDKRRYSFYSNEKHERIFDLSQDYFDEYHSEELEECSSLCKDVYDHICNVYSDYYEEIILRGNEIEKLSNQNKKYYFENNDLQSKVSTLKKENERLIVLEEETEYLNVLNEKNEEINKLNSKVRNMRSTISDKSKLILKLKCNDKDKDKKLNFTLEKRDSHEIDRKSKEYRRFKDSVLKRDNFTCQVCGSKNNPHVHHQYSFAKYNHLGATVSNGIVLCEDCHKKYHNKDHAGYFGDPYSFAIFMRENGKSMQSKLFDEDMNIFNDQSLILGGK